MNKINNKVESINIDGIDPAQFIYHKILALEIERYGRKHNIQIDLQ